MAGNNFPTSEEDVLVPTYYLDIDGLTDFWAKAKQYINNQNLSLNGQNIPLYPRGTTSNISIADAIANVKNNYVQKVDVYMIKNDFITPTVTDDESVGAQGTQGKQTKITLNPAGLIEKFGDIDEKFEEVDEILPNVVLHDEVNPSITAQNNQLTINVAGHDSNTVSLLTIPHADAATATNVLSSTTDANYPLVGTENMTSGGASGGGIGMYTVRKLYIQAEQNTDGSIAQSELYINPSKKLVAAPNIKSNDILSSIITLRSYEDELNEDHDQITIGNNSISFSNKKHSSPRSIKFIGSGGADAGTWSIENLPGGSLNIKHTNTVLPNIKSTIFGIATQSATYDGITKYNLNVAGNILPNPSEYTGSSFDIGSSTARFNNGYFIKGDFSNEITSQKGTFNQLKSDTVEITKISTAGKYYPIFAQHNTTDAKPWGYVDAISFDQASNTVYIGGDNEIEYNPSTFSLNPVTSGSRSLGTSSKKWQDIYVENVKSNGSSYFKDVAIQSYAWPADLTAPYQEPVTNGYIRNIINTTDLSQYGIPHDPTQDYLEIGLENYTTFTEEGVMSDYPAYPLKIYRDKLYFRDTCIVGSGGEMGLKDHTHSVTYTPSGTVASTFSNGSVSVGTPSGTVTVKSVKSVGSVPTRTEKTMPKSSHTHSVTYTPSGTVSSTFSNGSVSVNASTSTATTVKSVKSVGSVPTRTEKTMPKSSHTHSVTYTPSGTVSSSFSGGSVSVGASSGTVSVASSTHTHTIDTGDLSATFTGTSTTVPRTSTTGTTVASQGHTHSTDEKSLDVSYSNGVLTITSAHTHAASATTTEGTTVASQGHTHAVTAAGTISISGDDVTTGAPSGTTTVASSGHTHTGTATGTVTSTFTGTQKTATASATSDDECEQIYSITGVGSVPTTENVTVASSGHTHTGTATGTVTSTFTGTQKTATASATSDDDCETIYSITDVGSVPTTENVTVASSGHTHTGTATGIVTSTFTGTEDTVTTDLVS